MIDIEPGEEMSDSGAFFLSRIQVGPRGQSLEGVMIPPLAGFKGQLIPVGGGLRKWLPCVGIAGREAADEDQQSAGHDETV